VLELMRDIWMENRAVLGPGYDAALERLGGELDLTVHEVPSGEDVWTWKVPEAWTAHEAWFEANGTRYADFAEHPLHLWSYSLPFEGEVSREELLRHITTDPARPDAIPYDFRYYERDWGFCLPHNRLKELTEDSYRVHIATESFPGTLKVGEHVIEGELEDSIVMAAHLCHPAQANDDLAGVAVSVEVAKRLAGRRPRHTLRFLYLPEHIGSVAYLSRHEHLLPSFRYGMFLEMLGIAQPHALQHSQQGDSAIDGALVLALRESGRPFVEAGFLRVVCNDEQVMNGPGVGIPTPSLTRARPTTLTDDSAYPRFTEGKPYPEYHTSDDSLDIIDERALEESTSVVLRALEILDQNAVPKRLYRGTVHLSRHGLWVDWRVNPKLNEKIDHLMWCFEGDKTLIDIALELDLPFGDLREYVERFAAAGLVELTPA
jgi:aminopeptidase-like protein